MNPILIVPLAFFLGIVLAHIAWPFLKRIPPNQSKTYRMLMFGGILCAIVAVIWFGVSLFMTTYFAEFVFFVLFTIAPMSLAIFLANNWFRANHEDDKMHSYFAYTFILAFLALAAIVLFALGSPRGWLIPQVERGVPAITESGLFAYRLDIINNGTRTARARFFIVNQETGQEAAITIPNDRLRTLGGPITFGAAAENVGQGDRVPWDGSVQLAPTRNPEIYILTFYIFSRDAWNRWLFSHNWRIDLNAGEFVAQGSG